MTMLSFRVGPEEAARANATADALGIPRSEMLREALRRHLNAVAAEQDAAAYEANPLSPLELSLTDVEHWATGEDWSDWADATR
ncbi:MAG: ribbon-helix-helix protein, CopG family [Acidimicrobiaceae bacterium]|nr:ribbon-helix-helix protein, CopG family [Acidimicrobiaceae bacterium]MCY4176369.1 ribbon-helix-helix protein, CopG family [Acidimicrobiaceae bacterium]MCY4279099.1 ribbon-helix-helix protein, CopG family [Acidimicrobiaceae bacterium]MCY4294608.1 ribbon-helix-helix protein, CopG family [Acidimicrobiaceae bacterium]